MLPYQDLGDGLATLDIVSVTSDIAAAGTALAGLILVYLGAAAVRYETLDPKHQASARDDYRQHARRAFRGLVIALVAAVAAMTAKSLKAEPYATMIAAMAGLALLMSFFIAVMAAYWKGGPILLVSLFARGSHCHRATRARHVLWRVGSGHFRRSAR